MKEINSKNTGFSIIEIMVIVSIIALLGVISVMSYTKYIINAKTNTMLSAATAAKLVVTNDYLNDNNSFTNINYAPDSQPFVTPKEDFISAMEVVAGKIIITGDPTKLKNQAIVIELRPTVDGHEVIWTCYSGATFFDYVPNECKNAL